MNDIIAIILCGGESKRWGTDKGLMPIKDTIWAKFMADKLLSFNLPVYYSVNETQVEQYLQHIPIDRLIVDSYNLKGPATGLLSAHDKFPASHIFLLACDMLELDVNTIETLVDIYHAENAHDYYVYQDEQYAQPLCGIYSPKGIALLKASLIMPPSKNISMQSILNSGDTKRIAIVNKQAFENYNSRP